VLEIGASRALFGDWLTIEQRLRNELHELGFRHRLVAAPTRMPRACWPTSTTASASMRSSCQRHWRSCRCRAAACPATR
jgi:hypothetical protein